MQIAVNTRLLIKDKLDGIGWFSYQTLQRITSKNPDVHFIFLFDRPFHESFIFSANVTPVILSPQARHPLLYYAWFQYSVKTLLKKMKPDLFLSPDGFLSVGAGCKQLPVIHDINFYRYPSDHKWINARYYNRFFPRFAREATRIATVSEFSRKEIAAAYTVDASKIDVVYNGINPLFRRLDEQTKTETKKKFAGGSDYFVYVGALHPRKNIPTLIKAFAAYKKESGADTKLLLAGPSFWGLSEIHSAISGGNVRDSVILTGRISDQDLANVTGSALAMSFVSYYEGFGIPLVEAMAAGVPIITSNISSLPEIAGDAALLVNPFKVEEISGAMHNLSRDEKLRHDLITKGLLRSKEFSWNRTADLLWSSVQKALG